MLEVVVWSSVGVLALFIPFLVLYFYQDNLIYFPQIPQGSRTEFISPSEFGYDTEWQVEKVFFPEKSTTGQPRLQAWLLKSSPTQYRFAPTILFFSGNAGNISHRLSRMEKLTSLTRCNVFLLSYRGYGMSEGVPSESGLKQDAQVALNYLLSREDIDPERIVLFGESLGGAVSIYLASKNEGKIKAVILENTFTSIPDMIDAVFPSLKRLKFLCKTSWASKESIKHISCPILFLSGLKDELVPPAHMEALFAAATASIGKKIFTFRDGQHMTTWDQPNYWVVFASFMESLFSS